MKLFFLLVGLFGISACINKRPVKYITIDLELTCTPMLYFDTLSTVLITNDESDVGSTTKSTWMRLMHRNDRVYKQNLTKKNGHYYIDSVERKSYTYFLVAGNIGNDNYWGIQINNRFSENGKDTIPYKICIQPTIQSIETKVN